MKFGRNNTTEKSVIKEGGSTMRRTRSTVARFLMIALGLALALVPLNTVFASPVTIHMDGYLVDVTDTPVNLIALFMFRLDIIANKFLRLPAINSKVV